MPDVHLVTCARPPVPDADLEPLGAALAGYGVSAEVVVWDDPAVDWSAAGVTVVRSTWDYHHRLPEFLGWVTRVEAATALWNPASVLRWNSHKSYLLSLHARGVPIVPTVLLPQGSAAALDGVLDAEGWSTTVVKPAVGVGAAGAGRFEVGDRAGQAHLDALLAAHDVLVQPFVPAVSREGETAVVVVDGAVSHAVRKMPGPGDFRVQEQHGGRSEPVVPSPAQVELARAAVACTPEPTLYARVDVVDLAGMPVVMELEALEPALFLGRSSAATFADAIVRRLP